MHTLPDYQKARAESIRRSPWALVVVLAIVAAVVLLGPGGIGAPQATPGQPSVTPGEEPA